MFDIVLVNPLRFQGQNEEESLIGFSVMTANIGLALKMSSLIKSINSKMAFV